jgi:PRTRC genetic system protein C
VALKTISLQRSFFLEGRRLAEPDSAFTIEEVRAHYAGIHPELNNSTYTEEITDKEHKITFSTSIGHKG